MDDPSTERTLNRNLRGLLMCLLYFLTIHGCLYNQVPAHVWSTGAGNKYLYCKHRDKKKLPVDHVQCRLLIPALNAWAARVEHTTARLIAPQYSLPWTYIWRHNWSLRWFASYVFSSMCLTYFLTCYSWVFVQPGTGRRPVDWCRN